MRFTSGRYRGSQLLVVMEHLFFHSPLSFSARLFLRSFCVLNLILSQLVIADGFLEVIDEPSDNELIWSPTAPKESAFREGGFQSHSYLYLQGGETPLSLQGLSIPIRENPSAGEYRYVSFAWRRWGDKNIALQFDRDPALDGEHTQGQAYDYRLDAGPKPEPVGGKALRISENLGGSWQEVPLDLWKVFGDFTITGMTFLVESRDAGFDAIAFAREEGGFSSAAPLIQTKVAESLIVEDSPTLSPSEAGDAGSSGQVKVDWAGQIKAGGIWMYPLYFCAILALVISIQRLLTVNESRFAPLNLQREIRDLVEKGDHEAALQVCSKHPSTLAEVASFILENRHASIEVVNQTAGDMAARDVRGHLTKIYPLSLISSISPLLGLLGTIIGMVEAFGIVALYGDEGGASILSDSISKALITTAAGLMVAIPCIAVYFTLKNRIMRFATVIEVQVEELMTELYLRKRP